MCKKDSLRIVITGVGLTAPNGDSMQEYRRNLLDKVAKIENIDLRYVGKVHAGVCHFNPLKYQNKKDIRTGTRAGSVAIYCSNEALTDAGLSVGDANKGRIGVYVGITEHGNVETENEIHNISQFGYDVKYWNHYHNPRTVANNPAGEVTVNLGLTGPHYCIGAACAAGNAGIIQGTQQLMLGEIDYAIAGGVSESIHTFGIFAGFKSQGALAYDEDPLKASRPFDRNRTGIVVSEGGCLYVLETLESAKKRGVRKIYGEIKGYAMNSDGTNFVLPNPDRQAECMELALKKAGLEPRDIDIISTHATGTKAGDIQECEAVKKVFSGNWDFPFVNNTKGYIGHAMGAAGTLELAGNIPSFDDNIVHPCMNVFNLDKECAMPNLLVDSPSRKERINFILNNSFGMLGINSVLIVGRPGN